MLAHLLCRHLPRPGANPLVPLWRSCSQIRGFGGPDTTGIRMPRQPTIDFLTSHIIHPGGLGTRDAPGVRGVTLWGRSVSPAPKCVGSEGATLLASSRPSISWNHDQQMFGRRARYMRRCWRPSASHQGQTFSGSTPTALAVARSPSPPPHVCCFPPYRTSLLGSPRSIARNKTCSSRVACSTSRGLLSSNPPCHPPAFHCPHPPPLRGLLGGMPPLARPPPPWQLRGLLTLITNPKETLNSHLEILDPD